MSETKPQFGPDQPPHYCGKAGRSGARKGNRNALRHGLRGNTLPAGCEYIENAVNSLRRQVEDAVLQNRGQITITDAAAINSILKWEKHGMLAAHWLRTEGTKLSLSDRLKFSAEIARASDNRDRAIQSLDLDSKPEGMDLRKYIESKVTNHDA